MHQTQGHPSTLNKLMALIAQIDDNTVIMGKLNTALSLIHKSFRQKINKENSELLKH
jgi:hypothetical protein